MTRQWFIALGVSLALTLAAELSFSFLARRRGMALVFVALANILTNPVVVLAALLWRYYALSGYPALVFFMEALAVFTEGAIYKKSRTGFFRPYLFSLAANAISFTLGAILQILF